MLLKYAKSTQTLSLHTCNTMMTKHIVTEGYITHDNTATWFTCSQIQGNVFTMLNLNDDFRHRKEI